MRIHVTRKLPQAALDRLYATGWGIFVGPDEVPSRSRFLWAAGGAVGLLCLPTEHIDAEAMDRCPELRVISACSSELDNIDLEEARRRGVTVCHVPPAAAGQEVAGDEATALTAVDNLIAALSDQELISG